MLFDFIDIESISLGACCCSNKTATRALLKRNKHLIDSLCEQARNLNNLINVRKITLKDLFYEYEYKQFYNNITCTCINLFKFSSDNTVTKLLKNVTYGIFVQILLSVIYNNNFNNDISFLFIADNFIKSNNNKNIHIPVFNFMYLDKMYCNLTYNYNKDSNIQHAIATVIQKHLYKMCLCCFNISIDKVLFSSDRIKIGHYYKFKKHTGATNKMNVTSSEVIKGIMHNDVKTFNVFKNYSSYFTDLTDDQVCSILLYTSSLSSLSNVNIDKILCYALKCVYDTKFADTTNTKIKQYGLSANLCFMVEMKTLLGRGVNEIDHVAEASKRTKLENLNMANVDTKILANCIRKIYNEELSKGVIFKTLHQFWTSRWLWAANGAHSRVIEYVHPELATRNDVRAFRKSVLEQWVRNPMSEWDGNVYVTPSSKLEHGKTRLLLACDTLSYTWFEYFLGPVERSWKNKSTILDPGLGGTYGIAKRINEMRKQQGKDDYFLALDYDDFNSQHTIRAQKLVFEILFEHLGISSSITEKIINSFDNMYLWSGHTQIGKVKGTLMSGHRATSFINTVLNKAYIYASGVDCKASLHVGDDTIMLTHISNVNTLITNMQHLNIRLNISKQVLHHNSAEFLRVAHLQENSFGYLARAIASCVSGNWVSDHILSKDEALMNAITCTRSILNRSVPTMNNNVVRVIALSVSKRVGIPLKKMLRLLYGQEIIGCGVVFNALNNYVTANTIQLQSKASEHIDDNVENYATIDYLANHISSIEIDAMQQSGADIQSIMVTSSWKKSLNSHDVVYEESLIVKEQRKKYNDYYVHSDKLYECPTRHGIFERYPILMMLKNRISINQALIYCTEIGINLDFNSDLNEQLWGPEVKLCQLRGVLSYNDACMMARKLQINGATIYVDHQIFV